MQNKENPGLTFIILDKFGDPINVPIRYSHKAKRVIIKIQYHNVELILPIKANKNSNINSGYQFLLAKELWVRHKLQNSKQEIFSDTDNKTISLLGKQYSLSNIDSLCNHVQIKGDIIEVRSLLSAHNKTLIKFLKNKLLLEITNIVTSLSQQHKMKFSKIKLINSKSRWGSCSSNLTLRFNWRLIFTPQEILNYVIIHEMCHLIEMNHSKAFWSLVAKLYPEYKAAKLWLKENGSRVHQYLQI